MESDPTQATLDRDGHQRLRPPLTLARLRFLIFWIIAVVLLLIALDQVGFSLPRLWSSVDNVWNLMQRMWPPITFEWPRYLRALYETFFMVIAGTGLALILSIPIAFLSARNTTTGRIGFAVARAIVVFTRAVPDIVWALIFVRAIGIGAMAGVMAIGINSIGMLGKLYADAIEEAPKGPLDAIRAAGASRIQVITTGILPQVMPTWVSLALYRIDINVRTSVILGFVGAGGIGFELQRVLGQLVYRRGLTIVFMIFVLIAAVERMSAFARKAIIDAEGPQQNPFKFKAYLQRLRGVEPRAVVSDGVRFVADGALDGRGPDKLRPPRTSARNRMRSAGVVSVILFVVSSWVVDLTPASFFSSLAALGRVFQRMFPPDFVTNWQAVGALLLETFWIAVAATVLGMILSLPFAVLGARNVAPSRGWYRFSRTAMLVERGIPELILAVLFVVAVGLGPYAGVLALTIGAIGFSGKLMADGLENLPQHAVEGLTAVGASWLQRVFTAVLPQAMPIIVGIGIYTLDVYIRAATILGIVGAGGIGTILNSTIQTHAYDRTMAIVLVIFVAIYAFERFSNWLRQQLI